MSYQPADASGAVLLAIQASRALAAAGQGDMVWGRASIRDPDGRGAWMKAAGWGLEEIDAEKVIAGRPRRFGARGHGATAHRVSDPHRDHGGPAGRGFGRAHALGGSQRVRRAGGAACARSTTPDRCSATRPYPRFTLTGGLIKTLSLGAALAGALADAHACLMPQHGIVAVGHDAPTAVMTAVLLDRACRTQVTAMAAGPLRRWGDEQDTVAKRADVWSDRQMQAGWEYLLRSGGGTAAGSLGALSCG